MQNAAAKQMLNTNEKTQGNQPKTRETSSVTKQKESICNAIVSKTEAKCMYIIKWWTERKRKGET